jgi:hypothetical protein
MCSRVRNFRRVNWCVGVNSRKTHAADSVLLIGVLVDKSAALADNATNIAAAAKTTQDGAKVFICSQWFGRSVRTTCELIGRRLRRAKSDANFH